MENTGTQKHRAGQPGWWREEHDSTWERVKAAFRRDWEQTKNDFSKKHGRDLDQDVGDTLKQAAGKQPIPPEDFDTLEPAFRYGHGASAYYADREEWDDDTEVRLRSDWDEAGTGRRWDDVRGHVRRGWEWGRRKIS
jgi:hypothetical protein